MVNANVYVFTSDSYLPVLKPFCHLFNKFWSPKQKVKIVGFEPPTWELPDNFEFISLGKQRGMKFWSDDYIDFFNSIDDEYFVHMVENEFLLRPVDFTIVNSLIEYLDDDVGRIDFTPGPSLRKWDTFQEYDDFDIIELSQTDQYRLAIRLNLWNKKYFLKHLRAGENAWEFEIFGNQRAQNDGYKVLATNRKYACYIMDGTKAQDPSSLDLRAYNPEGSSFGLPLDELTIREMICDNIITNHGHRFKVI
tara:strand:+ start:350 stop:1099 length:750 start_codon:yes stop_codon:yes gene_type:complete